MACDVYKAMFLLQQKDIASNKDINRIIYSLLEKENVTYELSNCTERPGMACRICMQIFRMQLE